MREHVDPQRPTRTPPGASAPGKEAGEDGRITRPERLLPAPPRTPGLAHLGLADLLTEAARKATLLARKEMDLAQADARTHLRQGAVMATGLGIGGVSALLTVALLLVAVVFALIEAGLPGWASALIVAAAVLLVGTVAAGIGWAKRIRDPMATTRRTLQQNVRWAKELR